jgi:hypothetical protein
MQEPNMLVQVLQLELLLQQELVLQLPEQEHRKQCRMLLRYQ